MLKYKPPSARKVVLGCKTLLVYGRSIDGYTIPHFYKKSMPVDNISRGW